MYACMYVRMQACYTCAYSVCSIYIYTYIHTHIRVDIQYSYLHREQNINLHFRVVPKKHRSEEKYERMVIR